MTHVSRRISVLALTVFAALGAVTVARAMTPADPEPRATLALPIVTSDMPVDVVPIEATVTVPVDLGEFQSANPEPVAQAFMLRRGPKGDAAPARTRPPVTLSAARARILLQSLTLPGWGQLTTGHRTAASVFGIAELGVWSTYAAFRVQNQMRRDAYQRTARVLGGIEVKGRDEEFQRILGSYISSDEYNELVVARDAANLFYNDPVAFQAYIDEHSLKGADTWAWPDDQALIRYRGQRKDAQRAALRANAALAMAIVNRFLSAIHAARLGTAPAAQSWELQTIPSGDDPTALRLGVLRRF